ncbi:MAG: lipid-binding SYLF domain-containing protein [Acidobacteriota bacterium]
MKVLRSSFCFVCVAAVATLMPSTVRGDNDDDRKNASERLQEAGTVLHDITNAGDKGIPEDLLRDAHCAVVVPSLKKGAFIVSAKYGRGFVSCRRAGGWSAPAAIRIEGGGVGFQIGGSETELVLLVMNEKGAQKLMQSEFTVGAEGEVAAGPLGRNASAQTDGKFRAEILSWSRSRGVFGGVSLQAATLREDKDENFALYGKKLTTKEVVESSMPAPAAASKLIAELKAH